eukprot:SAG31_NODE_858_length_11437_cov_38.887049_5_plen_46_part_00
MLLFFIIGCCTGGMLVILVILLIHVLNLVHVGTEPAMPAAMAMLN